MPRGKAKDENAPEMRKISVNIEEDKYWELAEVAVKAKQNPTTYVSAQIQGAVDARVKALVPTAE